MDVETPGRNPGVAVVVPCRDAAPWIGELLDSLAAQTRRPDLVVVVDDGSRDGSAEVVEAWVRRDRTSLPVRLERQPPSGLAATVNRGVELSSHELVCRVDADDVVLPRYIEALAAALDEHPDASYAYPVMEMFGAMSGRYYTREFDAASLVFEGNFVCGGALMRRAGFQRTGGVAELPAREDWDLWLSFLDAGLTGVLVDESLYRWRRHERSRNTIDPTRRRILRLRIWWRHRGLVARYLVKGVPLAVRRLRHPIREH